MYQNLETYSDDVCKEFLVESKKTQEKGGRGCGILPHRDSGFLPSVAEKTHDLKPGHCVLTRSLTSFFVFLGRRGDTCCREEVSCLVVSENKQKGCLFLFAWNCGGFVSADPPPSEAAVPRVSLCGSTGSLRAPRQFHSSPLSCACVSN